MSSDVWPPSAQWVRWWASQASGWRVIECRTLWDHVQAVGDGGVYLHEVETTAGEPGAIETYRERESIVFARSLGDVEITGGGTVLHWDEGEPNIESLGSGTDAAPASER